MESITSHIKNTIYVGVERKMIAKKIETANVDSSNVFLRKLWGAIASASQFGWQYTPYTDKRQKIVDIGRNNLGHFYFTYKKRGTIDTLTNKMCHTRENVLLFAFSARISCIACTSCTHCIYGSRWVSELSVGKDEVGGSNPPISSMKTA